MKKLIFLTLLMGLTTALSYGATENNTASTENAKALKLFEEIFQQKVDRSPIFQTSLGIKKDYDKWDDRSEAFAQQSYRLNKANLAKLNKLERGSLSPEVLLSLRILEYEITEDLKNFKWRYHNYAFDQMRGFHTYVISVLTNEHKIENVQDAEDYIARLEGISPLFKQLLTKQDKSAELGVLAPKFVFPKVIAASERVIKGAPFDEGSDSILFADFKEKVALLKLKAEQEEALIDAAKKALLRKVGPAYQSLIARMSELEKQADENDGAWKFPDGKDFYQDALEKMTTTDLTAEEIHQLGLQEVKRIHAEMRSIMKTVKFEGDLAKFFEFIREDEQFYYPTTDEGRNAYLDAAVELVSEIKTRLPELFISQPGTDLIVKRVEPYREKSAGMAFYQAGAPDGSRPGIFYANLYDMREIAKYEMAALVYHEGLPGHHMQISIARELENVPEFRKYSGYTAYIEGWGLYSELLPKEIGLYQDPYSDFGRLNMELWRACRLVVDTGIHHYKWTRQQAIDYLMQNTPSAKIRAERSIDRYIVMPSQATAYKVGMLKILELREKAKKALGDKFDIREFHEVILASGPLPLNILEEQINQWIQTNSST